jgi:hypothetical protein
MLLSTRSDRKILSNLPSTPLTRPAFALALFYGNISPGGQSLVMHKFLTTLFFVFGLSACSTAYGEEVLNVELLCEGTLTPQFNDQEMADRYKFRQMLPTTMVPNKFKERLSIKDSMFLFFPLNITETKIEIDTQNEALKTMASQAMRISGSIDRLTGALDAEVLFISEEFITKYMKDNSEIPGMIGVVATGQCTKLDPKKKLF